MCNAGGLQGGSGTSGGAWRPTGDPRMDMDPNPSPFYGSSSFFGTPGGGWQVPGVGGGQTMEAWSAADGLKPQPLRGGFPTNMPGGPLATNPLARPAPMYNWRPGQPPENNPAFGGLLGLGSLAGFRGGLQQLPAGSPVGLGGSFGQTMDPRMRAMPFGGVQPGMQDLMRAMSGAPNDFNRMYPLARTPMQADTVQGSQGGPGSGYGGM